MIYIDTERLQEALSALESANNGIDEASHYLLQMTTHNNWGCRERSNINAYIREFRSEIRKLQENCNRFYQTTRSVSDEFIDSENGILNLFSSVEAMISKFLAMGNVWYNPVTVVPAASILNDMISNDYTLSPIWNLSDMWEYIDFVTNPYHTGNNHTNGYPYENMANAAREAVEVISDAHPYIGTGIDVNDLLSVVNLEDLII